MRNFSATAGDTMPVFVIITDQAGAAMNLTGVTAIWQASQGTPARFSPTPVLTKTTDAGITITNAAAGELQIDLEPADTVSLSGDFYHELQLTDASGAVTTPLKGVMHIRKQLVVGGAA
ncbi:hypothetical protein IGS68_33605 (plasmid) [Skermanella sp. TT6]|uniref:Uncharacterized protein n=1 Tax=Skermanella cutis TaxID=2775420 RepID=A0ABX7BJZ6_9PROT|nr:hypothetical protein [Skermanella sp. TT6]QQP93559.1 hypothetical protein IGS68_33605 [Skermanella sp. TT6]